MRDFVKLQSDLLQKIKKSYNGAWYHTTIGDDHFISDGHIVHIIPDEHCFIDFKKLFPNSDKSFKDKIKAIMSDSDKANDLKNLRMTVESEFYDYNLAKVFYNQTTNKYITISADRLKDFSDKNFKGTDEGSPVFIFDHETLICIVMPIQMSCEVLTKLRSI